MAALPMPPACPGGQLYTIARGDTLFFLAQRFGTTIEAIRAANPQITNPNVVMIGDRICIPGVVPPVPPRPGPLPEPPACPEGVLHTVAAGETMFGIARRYGLSLSQLIAANPQVTDPNVLAVGQRLCIPVQLAPPPVGPPPPACAGGTIAIVEPGDTMTAIARRFGVTVAELIRANPQVTDPNVLVVGQQLCVPLGLITGPGHVI